MTGYLSVTDERTLTPAGVAVVAKAFVPRTEQQATPLLPTYSGTPIREHTWERPFYNRESPHTSTIRGGIAAALYAGDDWHLLFIGDSKTEGSGVGGAEAADYAAAAQLRRMLGGVEGLLPAYATGNVWDSRWEATGFARTDPDYERFGVVAPAGGGTVTFTSDFAHTGGTFWMHAAAGAAVTVTVDGGTAQSLTIPAGNGFHAITPTVTGNSAHVYTVATTAAAHLAAFEPTYDGPRLKVSRMGRGGSKAIHWEPAFRAAGDGLWDATLAIVTPDAVVCGIGTNGVGQVQENVAAIAAVYAAIVALNLPTVVVAPGGLGGEGAPITMATYAPMYEAQWDAADAHDLPLIDFESIIGDYPTANAAGLMGDFLHENRIGYAYEAAAIRALLT